MAGRLADGGTAVAVEDIAEGDAVMAAKLGAPNFAITADVGDPDSVAALHTDVVARTGQIDILVNDAAIVPFTPWTTWTSPSGAASCGSTSTASS